MPYLIRIDPDALKYIKTRPPADVLTDLRKAIERFAKSPASLSKPATFPFVPGQQCFEHTYVSGVYRYLWHVTFKYSQDEQTILIARIGLLRSRLGDLMK